MENFHLNFGKYFGDRIQEFLDQIPVDDKFNEMRYLLKLVPYVEYLTNVDQPLLKSQPDGRKLCQILIDGEIIKGEPAEDLEFIVELKEGWYMHLHENDDIIHNDVFVLASILIVLFYVSRPSLTIREFIPSPMQEINFKIPKDSETMTIAVGETNELIIVDPSLLPTGGKVSQSLKLEDESSFLKLLSILGEEKPKPNLFIDLVIMPIFQKLVASKQEN